jgi:hypothetical protein
MIKDKIQETKARPLCPRCGQDFKIEVEVKHLLEKGNFGRVGLGYMLLMKCHKCGMTFPYFRQTASTEEFNEAVRIAFNNFVNNCTGDRGVGIATSMLNSFNFVEMYSWEMLKEILEDKEKK